MNKIIVIKNQQDAQDYVISRFAPTSREKRIGQAISGGLVGAGIGAGINYGINGSAKKGLLIGGALGALGGYAMNPVLTKEDDKNIGGGILSAFNLFYVVGSLPTGEVYYKSYKNLQDAKMDANNLKAQGVKAFVVTPNSFESNRQFGLIDLGNKRNLEVFGNAAKAHVDDYKKKNGISPRNATEIAKIERGARVAGMKAVKQHYGNFGAGVGSIGGAAVGTGVGYLTGKGIAKLKNKDTYIKEYLSKHPGASEREAQEAYAKRVKSFQTIGGLLGGAAGIYGGSKLGRNYGLKEGAKIAAKTSNKTILK